jgi:cyclopropane fatty-acyl-phospholipid synthase-like methyltransferase
MLRPMSAKFSAQMLPRALVLATLALASLACSKSKSSDPSMSDTPEHQHHGHHGHGQHGDVNEHGYKGHRFDDPAAWTEHFESAERTAWQKPDEVVASLALAPDAKIADIGAGTGYFSVRFAKAAAAGIVYAVDIEPTMVEWMTGRAQKEGHANMIAVQGNADDPKLPEAVDVVFVCNVFHHIADPTAYFERVAGKLRPGGRVIIVDFKKDNPPDAPGPPEQMRMTAQDIGKHMQAAGYELSKQDDELLTWQYVLEFRRSG